MKISFENAMKAYNGADKNGKKMLEALFGVDTFKPKDIKNRVKTFEDACNVLGEDNPFMEAYNAAMDGYSLDNGYNNDVIAYLKLRIITAALNEGWKPEFTEGECRYYPWYWLYTKDEYEQLSDEAKKNCCLLGGRASLGPYAGLACVRSSSGVSGSRAYIGSRLCYKAHDLAEYSAKQFADIWFDFVLLKTKEE